MNFTEGSSSVSVLQHVIRRRHSALSLCAIGCALVIFVWRPWEIRSQTNADDLLFVPAPASPPVAPPATPTPENASEVTPVQPSVIGFWRDDFYGKRVFQFREDGTATMVIELDSIGKALYGPQLKFFIDWKIEDDVLKMKMTGGEPASAFSAAKIFGESSEQRLESLEASEMRLRSLDSGKLYVHRRVDGWE